MFTMPGCLIERPKMTRTMYQALKRHIMKEREKKKQGELEFRLAGSEILIVNHFMLTWNKSYLKPFVLVWCTADTCGPGKKWEKP